LMVLPFPSEFVGIVAHTWEMLFFGCLIVYRSFRLEEAVHRAVFVWPFYLVLLPSFNLCFVL
jgi:hypothetical protein